MRDANEKLQEQAATHHERFVTTSRNNMAQYTEKATSLMKDKYQELQATTSTLHKILSTSLDQLQKARERSAKVIIDKLYRGKTKQFDEKLNIGKENLGVCSC